MKNKEIEVVLNYLKDEKWDYYPADLIPYKTLLMEERDILLLYIEQLEKELKEEQEDNYKQSQLLVEKQQKIEQLQEAYDKEKYLVDKLTRQLTDEYKNTEKQKERADHYKHLYSVVKKQKDDVVEYIKTMKIFFKRNYGKTLYAEILNTILRMLGEIDDK